MSMLVAVAPLGAVTCESLSGLQLPATKITGAQVVAAGVFTPPAGNADAYKSLPAFCRVQGVIAPSNDSHIEFEVWLPVNGWNRKYEAVGNGGYAGSINYAGMGGALAAGYATSSTDTGHRGTATDGAWALGHPEKRVDWAYRAVHEMAGKSKAVIRSFYGAMPEKSYFESCSNGGRQALMEAQRYPADFDGLVAGAPAAYITRLITQFAWDVQVLEDGGASLIPSAKLPAIERAALAACDSRDGVKDGVIGHPTKCNFDPAVLLCAGAESDSCLTAAQIAALKKIYSGPRDANGETLAPGFAFGGETGGTQGWARWIASAKPGESAQYQFATNFFRNFVFEDAAWDIRSFRLEREMKTVEEKLAPLYEASNPDLSAFQRRGGKLILYHGWSDPAIPPMSTINYYENVVKTMGRAAAQSFTRLYMVPGMQHCGGGPGTTQFNALAALTQWVEQKKAPAEIVARHETNGKTDRTRPLCPYPQEARYKGTGSTDDAANFVCGVN